MRQTCGFSFAAPAETTLITDERLRSGVRQDVTVKPALLPKLQLAVRTPVQCQSVRDSLVLLHDPQRLELLAAVRARLRLSGVGVPLMVEEGRPAGVPTSALVTHVRFLTAVRLDVNPQLMRRHKRLGADGARVLALRRGAVVLPPMPLERVLPEKLLAADVALVAELLRVDPHVDAEVRHVAESTSALGADELLLAGVDVHVNPERFGRREAAFALNTLVRPRPHVHLSMLLHIGKRPTAKLTRRLSILGHVLSRLGRRTVQRRVGKF